MCSDPTWVERVWLTVEAELTLGQKTTHDGHYREAKHLAAYRNIWFGNRLPDPTDGVVSVEAESVDSRKIINIQQVATVGNISIFWIDEIYRQRRHPPESEYLVDVKHARTLRTGMAYICSRMRHVYPASATHTTDYSGSQSRPKTRLRNTWCFPK